MATQASTFCHSCVIGKLPVKPVAFAHRVTLHIRRAPSPTQQAVYQQQAKMNEVEERSHFFFFDRSKTAPGAGRTPAEKDLSTSGSQESCPAGASNRGPQAYLGVQRGCRAKQVKPT